MSNFKIFRNKLEKLFELKFYRILISILLIELIFLIAIKIINPLSFFPTNEKFETVKFINSLESIFQIIFFIIIAIITILSFIQARKTLFTPIKTETFKMQIKAFEEILSFFQSKSETDFMHQFDYDFMVGSNSRIMMNDYVTTFFKDEIKINEDAMKELFTKFSGAIVSASYMEEHFHSPDYYEKVKPEKKEEISKPALILAKWKKYEYGQIHYSKLYSVEMDKLSKLIASPLIPSELKDKLQEFEKKLRSNLSLIGKVLTNISQELPEKFPTAKSLENLNSTGIWNAFNKEYESLEVIAVEILGFIRKYLKIDTLIS